MATDAENVPIGSIPSPIDQEHIMKKRILCAIGAMLITAVWSVSTVNAVSQHRQIYAHAHAAI